MLDGFRVIVCSPSSGDLRFLEILEKHLRNLRPLVDRWHLWLTNGAPTLPNSLEFANGRRDFIDPFVEHRNTTTHWTVPFYAKLNDPKTVYIKADDDIVWLSPDSIEKLVRFRIEHPEYLLVFANTVNNVICSHLHQKIGAIDTSKGAVEYYSGSSVGWSNNLFAEHVHRTFLQALEAKQLEKFFFPNHVLKDFEHFSINCFAVLGSPGGIGIAGHDETYLTEVAPKLAGKPNIILGDALVVHFAFFTQRAYLVTTDLLSKYRKIAFEGLSC